MGHCLFMRKGETHTAPISGILASDLAVGSSVYLMENGVATEYLVVNQGKPSGSSLYDDSCDGTWLLRKDCHSTRLWNSSSVNNYENSTIHTWLNVDYFNSLSSIEKITIKQVKIPYRMNGGEYGTDQSGENGLSTKVFLLSEYEVGGTSTDSYANLYVNDGAKLNYFFSGNDTDAKERRKSYLDGIIKWWWLRTPASGSRDATLVVANSGSITFSGSGNESWGIRPALVLPSNALFDKNTLILKGVA